MTKKDLLDSIESLLEVINSLYSKGPSVEEKKEMDELADKLDKAQNRLVKLMIQENDAEYVKLTGELGAVNSRIKHDLTALEKLRKILDGVKQAVELTTEIVKLLAVAAAA
jgi:hypothetical protein